MGTRYETMNDRAKQDPSFTHYMEYHQERMRKTELLNSFFEQAIKVYEQYAIQLLAKHPETVAQADEIVKKTLEQLASNRKSKTLKLDFIKLVMSLSPEFCQEVQPCLSDMEDCLKQKGEKEPPKYDDLLT